MKTDIHIIPAARLKKYTKLLQKKYRSETGLLLVEGLSLVSELVDDDRGVRAVLFDESRAGNEALQALHSRAKEKGIDSFLVKGDDFKRLCSTDSPPAVTAVADVPVWDEKVPEKPDALVVLVDGVQDPGNMGAILRTAAAFGCDAVYVSDGSCDVTAPRVVRGSMGALFRTPVFKKVNFRALFTELKEEGFRVFGSVASGGEDFRGVDLSGRCAICVGNEARGIRVPQSLPPAKAEGTSWNLVTIGLAGGVESLNVAVALGVLLGRRISFPPGNLLEP